MDAIQNPFGGQIKGKSGKEHGNQSDSCCGKQRMEVNTGPMGVPKGNFRRDGRQVIIKDTIEEIVPNLKKNCIDRSNKTLTFSKSQLKETQIYPYAYKTI